MLLLAACQVSRTEDHQPPPEKPDQPSVERRKSLLARHPEVHRYYAVDEEGVKMYADTAARRRGKKPECVVYWKEAGTFLYLMRTLPADSALQFYRRKGSLTMDSLLGKAQAAALAAMPAHIPPPGTRRQPLKGWKIAIDPGHLGGTMPQAMLEDRFLYAISRSGDTVSFNEGNLAWATATLLSTRLQEAGATVLITRSAPTISAFGKTYEQWVQEDLEKTLEDEQRRGRISAKQARQYRSASRKELFHAFFKHVEMRKRAEVINAFQPHLSIVIHYNVDENNFGRLHPNGYCKTTDKNFNMVFTPGAFQRQELAEARDRMELLRMLLSPDVDRSVDFSKKVMDEFERFLSVPAVPQDEDLSYLRHGCVYAGSPGVYARNLSLTRLIHSPVCFGESLYQDHEQEAVFLGMQSLTVGPLRTSPRVNDVAEAYYYAVLDYAVSLYP